MTTLRSRMVGFGHYLPENVVTNTDLTKTVDTSDEWIVERTGIKERRIAAENEKTSDLALRAAEAALESAGMKASEIDLIVLATTTPDNTFPATATKVQALLGMEKGVAFDVQAVCSGFVFALNTADNMIKCGQAKTALVIGAETFSRILDWNDRNTCVLFGDGAGAVVLKAEKAMGTPEDNGVLSVHIHSDGRNYDKLYCNGGPSGSKICGTVLMNGKEVFKHAVTNLAEVAKQTLIANNLTTLDIDWLLPHQANLRIIDATARKLGLDNDKVIVTVDRHANTSAASIPIALSEAVRAGKVKKGHLVMIDAMGGGFTWGAALIRI